MVRHGAFQRSSVYLETHIVIAEHMFSKLRGVQVSDNFYHRRARAYKAVVRLITEQGANFGELLFGILALQVTEFAIGRPDLMVYHLKAMDELVESHGGIKCLLQEDVPVELGCYTTHFITVEFPKPRNSVATAKLVSGFLASLRQIRAWTQRQWHDSTITQRNTNTELLMTLRRYLWAGVERHLCDPMAPYIRRSGYFHVVFHLCTIMNVWDMSLATAARLLDLVQTYMRDSADLQASQNQSGADVVNGDFDGLQPVLFAPLLPHLVQKVRNDSLRPDSVSLMEVAITEANVNALKAFSILSVSTRLRVSRALLYCCMLPCETTLVECFNEDELAAIASELQG